MDRKDRIKKIMERLTVVECNPWSHMNLDIMIKFLLPNDQEVENMERLVDEIEKTGCSC